MAVRLTVFFATSVILLSTASGADVAPPTAGAPVERAAAVSGAGVIRGRTADSEIVITTTDRLAGAIHSLTWRGEEFIDSADHGRQLQSASNFDAGAPFVPETFNPTEAGSRRDGAGPRSSSRLLAYRTGPGLLEVRTQMAFWLAPGETSAGHPALNRTVLSQHILERRVVIGHDDLKQVIVYDVAFVVPSGERHRYAQFEALTGYMPEKFRRFWKLPSGARELAPLDDGPGEQADPVVLATDDGRFAMGAISPDQPSPGYEPIGYGRFRFVPEQVVKWNCVFRYGRFSQPAGEAGSGAGAKAGEDNEASEADRRTESSSGEDEPPTITAEEAVDEAGFIRPGRYRFRVFVAVGTLEEVRDALLTLRDRFAEKQPGSSQRR